MELGSTGKEQRGLQRRATALEESAFDSTAKLVTKLVMNCVVGSLPGQLCALVAPAAINGSDGTSLKGRSTSFQWLEILQGKQGTKVLEPPLKMSRLLHIKQIC